MSRLENIGDAVVAINGCYFEATLPPANDGDRIRDSLSYVVGQKAQELTAKIGYELTPEQMAFCHAVVRLTFATMYLRGGRVTLEECDSQVGGVPIRSVEIEIPKRGPKIERADVKAIDGGEDE